MASEETEPLEQFNQSYNTLNPTNALSKNTLTQYIDGRIPDSNGTTEQIGTGRIDAFANKNTFSAIVVNVPPAGSPPYAGTSAEGLYKKGVITLDNYTQCLVYILGAHDDVLELPTDLSPQALSSEGEQQKYFKLATVATAFGKLNEPVAPGSIVTVEPINDTGRPESRIVNVVKTNPKSPAAASNTPQNAFNNNDATSLSGSIGSSSLPLEGGGPTQLPCGITSTYIPAHPSAFKTRSAKYPIDTVIIHTMQGTLKGTVRWFQKERSVPTATHYCVGKNGEVVQMVPEQYLCYHAGAKNSPGWNSRSIGIEHEGWIDNRDGPPSTAMLEASAKLVAWLCSKYNISINRNRIIGHIEVPTATHTDPGDEWPWSTYMEMINKAYKDKSWECNATNA